MRIADDEKNAFSEYIRKLPTAEEKAEFRELDKFFNQKFEDAWKKIREEYKEKSERFDCLADRFGSDLYLD